MSWRLEDSYQRMSSPPSHGYRGGTKKDSRYKSIQSAYQLLAFKKSIKREVSHNTPFSKRRSILKLLNGTFWSWPQPMTVKRYCMENANLKIMIVVKYSLNRRNTSCTVFSIRNSKVTWAKTIVRKYAPSLDAQSVQRDF